MGSKLHSCVYGTEVRHLALERNGTFRWHCVRWFLVSSPSHGAWILELLLSMFCMFSRSFASLCLVLIPPAFHCNNLMLAWCFTPRSLGSVISVSGTGAGVDCVTVCGLRLHAMWCVVVAVCSLCGCCRRSVQHTLTVGRSVMAVSSELVLLAFLAL